MVPPTANVNSDEKGVGDSGVPVWQSTWVTCTRHVPTRWAFRNSDCAAASRPDTSKITKPIDNPNVFKMLACIRFAPRPRIFAGFTPGHACSSSSPLFLKSLESS